MKSKSKKKRPAKKVSRSATKTIAPSKKRKNSAIREGIILAPIRSGGTGAAILFFDEADVVFGKRTAVRDSHERYAVSSKKTIATNLNKKERSRK